MSSRLDLRRGPKVGDAASLWNFTPAPGWTKEEVFILKLCLQKHGIGRWVQILDTGLLPGKLIQQLNGQTQRLLGQQSLAAYTGLQVDVDRIRADNEARTDVERKSGLIIWSGPNPTKAMKDAWRKEAQAKYGLTAEQLAEVEAQLAELHDMAKEVAPAAALLSNSGNANGVATHMAAVPIDALGTPLEAISASCKPDVLQQLHGRLQQLIQLLQHHNLLLTLPQGFSGFAAHRRMQQGPLPTTPAVRAAATDPAVLAESMRPNTNAVPPQVNVAATIAQQRVGKGGTAVGNPVNAAGPRKRQRSAGAAMQEKRPGGRRGPKQRKRQYLDSDSDDEAEDNLASSGRGGGSRRAGTAAGGKAALGSSGLIEELMGMGFSRAKALDALELTEGDMQAAIEWLVSHCVA